MIRYPFLNLSGSDYEIGYAHGQQAKDRVLLSLENYAKQFWAEAKLPWEDAKKAAPRYIKPVEAYAPGLLEEMRGIADGAGVEFLDILTLNARSEVLMTVKGELPEVQDGCTNIAVSRERTTNRHTLLAHNWDWKAAQKDAVVVLKIHPVDTPDILMITEAGIVGKFGVNANGVAVAMNALRTPDCIAGVPVHCTLRGILNSPTLGDALSAIVAQPSASAANFMLAGSCGEVLDCERVTDDYHMIYPKNCVVTHANYIVSERLKSKYRDNVALGDCSSFLRHSRSAKLIGRRERISPVDLKEVLSDHADAPRSICAHPQADLPAYLARCTVFSILIDTDERSMEICPGNPCCGQFYKVAL